LKKHLKNTEATDDDVDDSQLKLDFDENEEIKDITPEEIAAKGWDFTPDDELESQEYKSLVRIDGINGHSLQKMASYLAINPNLRDYNPIKFPDIAGYITGKDDDKKNEMFNEDALQNEFPSAQEIDSIDPNNIRDIFEPSRGTGLRLRELKYFAMYPNKVRQWIINVKSNRGYYNEWGRWVPVEEVDDIKVDKKAVRDDKTKEMWEDVYQQEQSELPEMLKGKFKFGIEPEEMKDRHPKLKILFSFKDSTDRQKNSYHKKELIKKYKSHESDTGTNAIQVGMLTIKIRQLMNHLKENRQDKRNIRSLQRLVSRRHSLMIKLKQENSKTYFQLLVELKLADSVRAFR